MQKHINAIIDSLKPGAIEVASLLGRREVGYSPTSNASGEEQLKADLEADRLFTSILSGLDLGGLASEEKEEALLFDFGQADSKSTPPLFVAFDPLDGSSLMDSNLSVGSIFGIYKGGFSPQNLIASCYFIYGPRLELVVAMDGRSAHYLYGGKEWNHIGDFRLKDRGSVLAPGGTQKEWPSRHRELISSFFQEGYRLRYSGGLVPDAHQILCKGGGLFSYPATSGAKNGKLRKLFEVYPFALIFENAGGLAIDGKKRLLDGNLEGLHDRSPCFFGSRVEVERVLEFSN